MESIRYGTYDVNGEIYLNSSQYSNQESQVTTFQKVMLSMLSIFCCVAVVYSCFVHHQLTNLLLKSLGSDIAAAKRKRHQVSRKRSDFTEESEDTSGYYA